MIKTLLYLIFILPLFFVSPGLAQIVPIDGGSYTKTFPGTDAAGRNGYPSGTPQISGSAIGKPVPTNDWWSKLLKENHADNLFNYPMTMKTTNEGLVVTYIPSGVIDDQQPIVVGVDGLNASKITISDYSDWTVSMNWTDDFEATSGIGMPFVYFEKSTTADARIEINLGNVTVNDEMILVTDARNGADFAIYAPTGSTWNQNGKVYTSSLNGQNYWSMAMLPQDASSASAAAEEFQEFAYVFPASTTVNWSFDEMNSVMRTDFATQVEVKEGVNGNILQGLLPHQWANLANGSPEPLGHRYSSIRGELKMLEGNSFSVENSFHGILPTLPYLSNYSEGFDPSELNKKVELLENDGLATWTDSYNEGQMMNRLIQTARIADKIGNYEARDKMIGTIKERLEDWLTAEAGEVAFIFYYNSDWTTLLGYPAGHGQDTNINDHHFHWGYFIHAAAFMEQYEPGWADQWGGMVNLLIRDAAGMDRNDTEYPFLRNFSPYAGHCWANGFASFPQGNDQESTSESMQFNSSLIHWGSITGNDDIRDLGIYLYTTEQSAVEEYWFDINERVFNPGHPYSLVSRVWGNSFDNGTFWTSDIAASYGIELYPIHGGSTYLGHNLVYAEKLWAEIESNTGILNNEENVNLWHDTMWKYLAFTDPQKAIDLYDSYPDRNLKFGISDAHTYYWLHAMNAVGQIDVSVTANYPLAVVFRKDGQPTYVAHNYSASTITVDFSDGYQLIVPAHTMATSNDLAISGSITSSFSTAYPGGSVDLSVVPQNGTPTKIEFYKNGSLIGEAQSEPFVLTAANLVPGVYNFYAKIYDGEAFNVSNIVKVVVGNQLPYPSGAHQIPGAIDAGNYDYFPGGSGQGISYQDTSPGNNGGFRPEEDVDASLVNGEGATVGWIGAGEWLEYTINVDQSAYYDLSVRFASGNQSGGGPFYLELDGEKISNNISLAYTGDWDQWQTKQVADIPLPAGEHILRLFFDHGEFNIGRMTFSYAGELPYGPPIANAGENVVVIVPATTAQLDGSMSSDPDGDPLTYSWEQVNGPSVIDFSDNLIAQPTVSNLKEGIYTCHLTVADADHSSTDEVLIIVSLTGNTAPTVAIASPESNADYEEGSDVEIKVNAADLEGPVTLVEFYDGATKIGEDSSEPFILNYLNPTVGEHVITAVATDADGVQSTSEAVVFNIVEVKECKRFASSAQQGSFSTGYISTFKTVGSSVTITFELLDTDKQGVVAFLWQESPFAETAMTHLGNNRFSTTVSGLTDGEQISYACKFAFAGGLAATTYVQYQVGSSCASNVDEEGPDNFTISYENLTSNSVDLALSASDNSGEIIYVITYGTTQIVKTGDSGTEISVPIQNLQPATAYQVSVTASDPSGNQAENSPLTLNFTTLEDSVLGLEDLDKVFHAYPNPVLTELRVEINSAERFEISRITNASGQEQRIRSYSEAEALIIDFSSFERGVYFVHLTGKPGYFVLKVIRN